MTDTPRPTEPLREALEAVEDIARHRHDDSAWHDVRTIARAALASSPAPAGLCGCTYDDSEPSGVCRVCHHREHGPDGCRAATRPAEPDDIERARLAYNRRAWDAARAATRPAEPVE